ncbi:MAG TPA: zinc ribbon domain-containing protein [Longimicrobium sp.]|nr:zinc ribbon domain-containing protein [Longimicrobium sp.]
MDYTVTCPTCGPVTLDAQYACPTCRTPLTHLAMEQLAGRMRSDIARIEAKRPPKTTTTVNGSGTMLLDYRPAGDGTYTATRWVTLAYLPLVPLSRTRVRPVERTAEIMGQRYLYDVVGKEPLDPASILRTYLFTLLAVVPVIFAFVKMEEVTRAVGDGPGFLFTAATIVWFVFMMTRFANADRVFRDRKDA